ncbi:MAG: hypothetical protein IT236_07150 [Bacteroidia bacterium]|nr:hypothetical protein [Bacteroidia bacterium]
MKENIRDKIKKVVALANSSVKENNSAPIEYPSNDSLSKSIRNKQEADIFLAELDAAFKMAQSR